jgi:hypothetical protein
MIHCFQVGNVILLTKGADNIILERTTEFSGVSKEVLKISCAIEFL